MKDLVFEVTQESDGGYVAECLTEAIVTQADTWEGLRRAVTEAVAGYFFDAPSKRQKQIRPHLIRDEIFAVT
jgi:predicted RNase H-like HicB family nuclease